MPIPRFERVPTQISFAASGSINLELSPVPYTITEIILGVRADVTTTTATNFNDYWDRIITRLSLSGLGKTYFDFSNMRAAYHATRFWHKGTKRPTVIANSQTNAIQHFFYRFHLGVSPWRHDPATGCLYPNPYDLTAGVPPTGTGNLRLSGSYGAAAAMGTNVTVNDADIDVYLLGMQPEPGDSPRDWMPRAFPKWEMESPTLSATSTAFATRHNIPSGDFLHSIMMLLTDGTNDPRDDDVLNSLQLWSQIENRDLWSIGGQAGAAADFFAANAITQEVYGLQGWPPSDDVNGTIGLPVLTQGYDEGLIYLPVHLQANRGHKLYGADLRKVTTGDLQLRYGIADATGVGMHLVYRKYELNAAHPDNVGA